RPGRRDGRHRPPLWLEFDAAAGGLRHRVGGLGRVPRHPRLSDPVAADARRRRLNTAHAAPGRAGPALRVLQWLGVAWTLPNTVAGLLLGVIGLPRGAHLHLRMKDMAIV